MQIYYNYCENIRASKTHKESTIEKVTESQTDIDQSIWSVDKILHLGNFGTYNGSCVSNQRLENVSIKETCIQLINDIFEYWCYKIKHSDHY